VDTLKIAKPAELLYQIKNIPDSSRKKECRIKASNDAEAVQCFLDEYRHKLTTFRSYKKEAERFLVWCIREQNTSLNELNREAIDCYIQFLKNPEPRSIWCGPKKPKNVDGKKEWFPFAGPLSPTGIKTALTILNSMMSYLCDARYIDFNPFSLIRRKGRFDDEFISRKMKIEERILNREEWQEFLVTVEEEPENTSENLYKKQRLKFLIAILFFLGLRIDEVSKSTWNNFVKLQDKWWFLIKGKGDRIGKIPVNSSMLTAMMTFRHFQNIPPLPTSDDDRPILVSIHKKKALSVRQLSNIIKDIAQKTAIKFVSQPKIQNKLAKMSPHWLRHLSASKQDLAGISFTNIKNNLRHQNEQTTRQYVHAFDDDRHDQMEKLSF